MPKISIIIPVYKVETFLHRCMDSIISQTFANFELILVDDGSPDGSGKTCEEYMKEDVRVKVIHRKNGGLSAARNTGIDIACGEYIMFCDSDDWVALNWCEVMLRAIETHPMSFVVCDIMRTSGNIIIHPNSEIFFNEVDYFFIFKKGVSPFAWNKIYYRDIIKNNKLRFDESCYFAEDVGFTCAYFKYLENRIVFVDSFLYYYFYNKNSIMHQYYYNLLELNLPLFYIRLQFIKNNQLSEYCDEWAYMFLHMLNSTFDKRNKMSFTEKLRYNHRMMSTKELRYCFAHASWKKEGTLIKLILKTHNYYIYYLYNLIIKAKRHILTIINNVDDLKGFE